MSKANRTIALEPGAPVADADSDRARRDERRAIERSEASKASSARDRELVAATLAGDQNAFRELVEKYQSKVHALAFEILRSTTEAEDVVQETFVKAYLSLPSFRSESSFYTWLYRIAYNMAVDVKRKVSRRERDMVDYDDVARGEILDRPSEDRSVNPQEMLLRKERAKHIARAFSDITEEHRTVLFLREIDGLNYEDIAHVTGVSKGTVMSRLHYARKKVQKALSDWWPNRKVVSE